MRKIVGIITFCLFLAGLAGCERTETAIDLYKKVKQDAKQKSEQAQDEAGKIIKRKLDGVQSEKSGEDEEADDQDKD